MRVPKSRSEMSSARSFLEGRGDRPAAAAPLLTQVGAPTVGFYQIAGGDLRLVADHADTGPEGLRTAPYYSTATQRAFRDRYSSSPWREPSRPIPDSLIPPKGAISVEMSPVLTPTIPYWSPSATRQVRLASFV